MRLSVIVGIVLIIAGVTLYFRGYKTKEKVIDVGPVSVSAEESHPVAPWVAGVVVLAGVGLIAVGARRTT